MRNRKHFQSHRRASLWNEVSHNICIPGTTIPLWSERAILDT